jgi:hypothetical protein
MQRRGYTTGQPGGVSRRADTKEMPSCEDGQQCAVLREVYGMRARLRAAEAGAKVSKAGAQPLPPAYGVKSTFHTDPVPRSR